MSTEIKIFDRIVVTHEFNSLGQIVPVGTIGTCRQYMNNDTIIIQCNYYNDSPKYVGIPVALVRLATAEDLDKVQDYKNLIPKIYHNNNKFVINDEVWTITSIRLAQNEKQDTFIITAKDTSVEYSREVLDTIGSYVPIEIPTEVPEIQTNKPIDIPLKEPDKTIENAENMEDDVIKITINDIQLILTGNDIAITSTINLKNIDKVIIALESLNKLKNIMKGNG